MAAENELMDPAALLAELAESGLDKLFENEAVCTTLKQGLREAGCPPPTHIIVFALLKKGATLGWDFGGEALKGRLVHLLGKSPRLTGWLHKVATICKGSTDGDAVKAMMLAHLRGEGGAAPLPELDETTDGAVLQELYTRSRFDQLDAEMAGLADMLQDLLHDKSRNDAIDQRLGWAEGGSTTLADAIRYNSGKYRFIGREAEIDLLHRLCGDVSMGPGFSWLLLWGAGGEGKTRLAMEFTTRYIGKNWRAGRMSLDDLRSFNHAEWLPRQPTFIVIDYPAQDPTAVRALLGSLGRRRRAFDWPVRVLLLERDAKGQWFDQAFPQTGDGAAVRACAFRLGGEPLTAGLPIPPVPLADVVQIMQARFAKEGTEPPVPEILARAAYRVDPRAMELDGKPVPIPRPLFAAAMAELMVFSRAQGETIDAAWADSRDREELFDSLIKRDRSQNWLPCAGGNKALLKRHENLAALATLAGGFPRSALRQMPPALADLFPAPGEGAAMGFDANLADRISGFAGGSVRTLEPDLLGEHFALRSLAAIEEEWGKDARQQVCSLAFLEGGDIAHETALRTALDFRDRTAALGWLLPAKGAELRALHAATALVVDLTNRFATRAYDAMAWTQQLDFADAAEPVLATRQAMAAVNVTNHAGEAGDWNRVDAMLSLLAGLRANMPENPDIVLSEAQAAVNVTSDAGKAKHWDRVDAMLSLLVGIHAAMPEQTAIALALATAAFNVANSAGDTSDWGRVDAMLSLLADLREAMPDQADIALVQAKAAVNVSSDAGRVGDWSRVDVMLTLLAGLRAALPDNTDIAIQQAMAAVNFTNFAGKAGNWDRVDAMLSLLSELRAAMADKADIALEQAKAAVNVSHFAGQAGDWNRVDSALNLLAELRSAKPEHAEIGTRQVRAAINVTVFAALAGHWERVDSMLAIGRELLLGPHLQIVLQPLLRLWQTTVEAWMRSGRPVEDLAVKELAALVLTALKIEDQSLLPDIHQAMIMIKHCHANGFATQLQPVIDDLAEKGLDWTIVPDFQP